MTPPDPELIAPPAEKNETDDDDHIASQPRAKLGVLVVEDDRLLGLVLQLTLERNGFDVWLASAEREAIQLYQTHREQIAVVLFLDVRLPGLDAVQILDALRGVNSGARAWFLSGALGSYSHKQLIQRGAEHVFTKPFNLTQLTDKLHLLAESLPLAHFPSESGYQGHLQEQH
jgi:two-component system sensor histidine kinase BarA